MNLSKSEVAAAEDLVSQYADVIAAQDVRRTFWHAMSDLTGSIHPESRAEMAVRLARVRLAERLTPTGTFGDEVRADSTGSAASDTQDCYLANADAGESGRSA